jgi:hypothetical protein
MSRTKAKNTLGVEQDARPEYHLGRELLDGMLTALPRPPVGAPVAWRHARLRRVINEISALGPFDDCVQAMFAGHVILHLHSAADLVRRSLAHEVPAQLANRMRRTADEQVRVARQIERTLKRGATRTAPEGRAPAADGFDLAALDAVWCGNRAMGSAGPTSGTGAWGHGLPAADPGRAGPVLAGEVPDGSGDPSSSTVPVWARQPGWRC